MEFDLKKIRTEKNITQQQLAQLTGLSQQHLSLIERRKELPNLKTLEKICSVLNVQIIIKYD